VNVLAIRPIMGTLMMNQRRLRIQILSAVALVGALTSLACPASLFSRGPWHDWEMLRLDVQAIPLLSGQVELHRFIEDGRTFFETTSTARLLGAKVAEARTRSVLDEETGRSESYESVSSRSGRRFVFGEAGYRLDKLTPTGDASAPLDEWQVESSREFPYPEDAHGNPVEVFDYYGMILHLGDLDLNEVGDEALIHVATSDGVVGYRIVVADSREAMREFIDTKDGSTNSPELTELRLRFLPADPDRAPEGFLRMEGESEIWVEKRSKTLLQINGRVPNVPGEVRLVLSEMG
jgi:hypothetical protein